MPRISKRSWWNESKVKGLLAVSNEAVQDALITVYNNQTPTEQDAEATIVENGKGFGGTDAEFGTSLAKQLLKLGNLSPKQWPYARKIALRYWGQFAESLNTEREAQGLSAVQPKLPKGAATVVDRFTWQPGDLKPVEEPVPVIKQPELFDGDEPDPEPEYRDLNRWIEESQLSDEWDAVMLSKEWALYCAAHEMETEAWLQLVDASTAREGHRVYVGTVTRLRQVYREAEVERERVCVLLGMRVHASKSFSFAAKWHQRWGQGYPNANLAWLNSDEYELWAKEKTGSVREEVKV